MKQVSSLWAFVDSLGRKMSFTEMNDTVLGIIESVKEKDTERKKLELDKFKNPEDFSISIDHLDEHLKHMHLIRKFPR